MESRAAEEPARALMLADRAPRREITARRAAPSGKRTQIATPATKATYRERALDPKRKGHVPRFDDELQPADIDLLARWVRARARGLPSYE